MYVNKKRKNVKECVKVYVYGDYKRSILLFVKKRIIMLRKSV